MVDIVELDENGSEKVSHNNEEWGIEEDRRECTANLFYRIVSYILHDDQRESQRSKFYNNEPDDSTTGSVRELLRYLLVCLLALLDMFLKRSHSVPPTNSEARSSAHFSRKYGFDQMPSFRPRFFPERDEHYSMDFDSQGSVL